MKITKSKYLIWRGVRGQAKIPVLYIVTGFLSISPDRDVAHGKTGRERERKPGF